MLIGSIFLLIKGGGYGSIDRNWKKPEPNKRSIFRDSDKEIVIVTGSRGLLGTRIIKRLAGNFRMIGFDKIGNSFPPVGAEFLKVLQNFDVEQFIFPVPILFINQRNPDEKLMKIVL